MRKKIVAILLLFIVVSGYSKADEMSNTEQEILNFKDKDVVFISKTRMFVLDCIKRKKYRKVQEVLKLLNRRFAKKEYAAFSNLELLIVLFWIQEYELILINVADDSRSKKDILVKPVPVKDEFLGRLVSFSIQNRKTLIKNLSGYFIPEYKKELLLIFLDMLTHGAHSSKAMQKRINKSSDKYLNNYPKSPYVPFVKKYLRRVYKDSDFTFGIGLASGVSVFSGNLGDYFSNAPLARASVEMSYKRFFLSGFIHFTIKSSIKQDFSANGLWDNSMESTAVRFGLIFGMRFINEKRFKAGLFAGISTIQVSELSEEDDRLRIGYSPAYSVGFELDFESDKLTSVFLSSWKKSHLSIKIRGGITIPTFDDQYSNLTGNILFFEIGFSIFHRKRYRQM